MFSDEHSLEKSSTNIYFLIHLFKKAAALELSILMKKKIKNRFCALSSSAAASRQDFYVI